MFCGNRCKLDVKLFQWSYMESLEITNTVPLTHLYYTPLSCTL